ncbi:hypothetical protein ABZ557_12960 [Streptomyces sp. NPDC019645]|uniref:hypothetical protein n=1 Tax=Streptomyces sp. NPDC019645 TaxID=3154786 RepID=UPI0033D49EAA
MVGGGWGTVPPRGVPGPGGAWQDSNAYVVSAAGLFMATVLALEVHEFVALGQPSPVQPRDPGVFLLMIPFLLCFGLPVAVVGTAAVVLPVAVLAAWLGRRFTGHEAWWWVPPASAGLVAVPAAAVAVWKEPGLALGTWLVGTSGVAVAALLARQSVLRREARRPGLSLRTVLLYGTLLVAVVFALGGAASRTGLLDVYSPPRMTKGPLTGTWSDGGGGTLRLSPDGTAEAVALRHEPPEGAAGGERCGGTGTWRFVPDDDPWRQAVAVAIPDCALPEWSVGGTADALRLHHVCGDPDSPDVHTLARVR